MYQNVTLKLDKGLLHQAKLYATQEKSSLSRLMVEALRTFLGRAQGYEKARKKAVSRLKKGWKLGGGPYWASRSELHERHGR